MTEGGTLGQPHTHTHTLPHTCSVCVVYLSDTIGSIADTEYEISLTKASHQLALRVVDCYDRLYTEHKLLIYRVD